MSAETENQDAAWMDVVGRAIQTQFTATLRDLTSVGENTVFMVTASSSTERPASLIEMFLRVITIQFVLRQILGLHLNMEEATHDQNLCLLILTLFQTLQSRKE